MCGILLNAYLPTTAPKMMEQLGLDASALDLTKTTYGAQQTYTVHKGEALFPRIDVAKEIAHLKEEDEKRKAAAAAANKAKEEAEKKAAAPAEESTVDFTHEEEIDFDTFCKVELRVAEVRACENLKESKSCCTSPFLTASGSAASCPALPSGSSRRISSGQPAGGRQVPGLRPRSVRCTRGSLLLQDQQVC